MRVLMNPLVHSDAGWPGSWPNSPSPLPNALMPRLGLRLQPTTPSRNRLSPEVWTNADRVSSESRVLRSASASLPDATAGRTGERQFRSERLARAFLGV